MLIVGLSVVAVGIGWFLCSEWKEHRVGHYKKQLEKAILFCDTMKDTNEILVKKIERLHSLGVRENENSTVCKVDRGVLKAIADMQSNINLH